MYFFGLIARIFSLLASFSRWFIIKALEFTRANSKDALERIELHPLLAKDPKHFTLSVGRDLLLSHFLRA